MQINYYINGQEVNRPLNYKELSIELNFDKDNNSQSTSLTSFEWGLGDQLDGNDAARLINAHKESGLCFEGLPLEIELEHVGTTYTLFDGYLNTATALYDCDKVIIQAIEKKKLDYVNEVFDSKSYAYIYEKENIFTDADFLNVPYVLSELPETKDALLASLSGAFLVITLIGEIQELKEYIQGIATLAWEDIVKISLRAIYIIGLVVLIVKLMKEILDLLIQPVKYHSVMSELKHCQIGAESFGFTFASSILENAPFKDSYILPEKYSMNIGETKNGNLLFGNDKQNTKNLGYFNGTVGDFFREMKKKYNAKIIIQGSTLRLERKDWVGSANNYIVPPVDQTDYKLNSEDLKSNYVVRFATDINDKNTIQRYEGVSTQVITSPLGGRTDYTILSGLETNALVFARGLRKSQLTNVEKIMTVIFDLIDGQINTIVFLINGFTAGINAAFDGVSTILTLLGIPNLDIPDIPKLNYSNFVGTIQGRIGMLLMENDFVDVPKCIILDVLSKPSDTKVSLDDTLYNNSLYLYDNFHFIESFIPSDEKPNANQYLIYEKEGVPFCFDDYELVTNSSFIQDDLQRSGELISLKWNPEQETASMEFKINELYTDKLTETKITPDGK